MPQIMVMTPEEYAELAQSQGLGIIQALVEQYSSLHALYLKEKESGPSDAEFQRILGELARLQEMVKALKAKKTGTGPGDPGGGDPGGTLPLFANAVYPTYDTLIQTTDDPASIINTGSTNHIYCFEAGIHDATQWSDIVKPKSGCTITAPTINGDLIQYDGNGEGDETGYCGAVIRGSQDISGAPHGSQVWTKIGGRDAWTTTVAGLPSQMSVNNSAITRTTAGGWVRRSTTDNPPTRAGYREEVFIAEPATTTDDLRPIYTAERCQQQDTAAEVDGTRAYGNDSEGNADWRLNRTIVMCHIDHGTNVVTIGADPTDKIITISRAMGSTSKGRPFGGTTNDLIFRNLNITQIPTDIQNGALQGGEDRYDYYEVTGWDVQQCHISNCHGAGINLISEWTVKNCIIEKCGQVGALSSRHNTSGTEISYDWTFSQNILRNNATSYIYGWNTELGATKFKRSKNVTCERNLIHDNPGPGLWFDVDNSEGSTGSETCQIAQNIMYNNYYGLFYELSDGPANIYRNLCIDNGGFQQHGNPNNHTFRKTAQIRIRSSGNHSASSTTKDIDVHENVAVIHPVQGYDSGSGGDGHNSHGISGSIDTRSKANHIQIYNNHIIHPRANTGDQLSLSGFYSNSGNTNATDVSEMNSSGSFTGNTFYYPGSSSDLIMHYSDTASDLGKETLSSFEAKQSAYNNNTIVNDTDIPVYNLKIPSATFNPQTLTKAPRAS